MADGLPGDSSGSVPDPAGDPDLYEGEGGGPAGPEGEGISASDKAATNEMYTSVSLAGAYMGLAGAVLTPINPMGGTIFWVSEAIAFGAIVLDLLANDPPQPYERIVHFRRRAIQFPETEDAQNTGVLQERMKIGAQRWMFAGITGLGYLRAAERRDGAILAKDVDWAITHDAVMRTTRAAFRYDMATAAVATMRCADELRSSTFDVPIEPDHLAALKTRLADGSDRNGFGTFLKANGISDDVRDAARQLQWSSVDRVAVGEPPSDQLRKLADSVYQVSIASFMR